MLRFEFAAANIPCSFRCVWLWSPFGGSCPDQSSHFIAVSAVSVSQLWTAKKLTIKPDATLFFGFVAQLMFQAMFASAAHLFVGFILLRQAAVASLHVIVAVLQ